MVINFQGLLSVQEFEKQKYMNSTFDELLVLMDIPHTKGSGWYEDKKLKVEQLLERQQLLQQTAVSGALPSADDIANAAIDYLAVDTVINDDMKDAAHFVAGATWVLIRLVGNDR